MASPNPAAGGAQVPLVSSFMLSTKAGKKAWVEPVLDAGQVLQWQQLVRSVAVAPHVQDYAVRLVLATHPEGEQGTDVARKYVRFGSSPRGAQALILGAKVRALVRERYNIAFEDIRKAALPALRNRLILNCEAQAEGVTEDSVVKQILGHVPTMQQ